MATGSLLAEVSAGIPGCGSGAAYFYVVGTTTLKAVYADKDLSTVASNPKTLDSNGAATIWTDGPVRIVAFNSSGVQTWDYTLAGTETAAEVAVASDYWTDTDLDAVLEKLGASVGGTDGKIKQVAGQSNVSIKDMANAFAYNVKSWGAVGNGTADDTTAIQNALDYVAGLTYKGTLYFPPGNYKISAALALTSKSGFKIVGAGMGQVTITQSGSNVNGLVLTSCTDFVVSDFSMAMTTRSSGRVGITLSLCGRALVKNVQTTATDNGTDGFDYGANDASPAQNTYVNCDFAGYTRGFFSGSDDETAGGSITMIGGRVRNSQTGTFCIYMKGISNNRTFIGVAMKTYESTSAPFYVHSTIGTGITMIGCGIIGGGAITIAATGSTKFRESGMTATGTISIADSSTDSQWESFETGAQAVAQLTTTGNFTPDLVNGRHFLFDSAMSAGAQTATLVNPTNGSLAKKRGDQGFYVSIKITTANAPTFAFGSEYAVANIAPALSTTNGKTNILHFIWDGAKWRIAGSAVMDT